LPCIVATPGHDRLKLNPQRFRITPLSLLANLALKRPRNIEA